jgi:hypothetical protein
MKELLRLAKAPSEMVFSDLLGQRTAMGTPPSQILASSISEETFS